MMVLDQSTTPSVDGTADLDLAKSPWFTAEDAIGPGRPAAVVCIV
jgi:hypothetical protein